MQLLNIWSPRPKNQSKHLKDGLIDCCKVHPLPMIDIIFLDYNIDELNRKIEQFDGILFISQNSVIGLDNYDLPSSSLINKIIFAIGEATENRLKQSKIKVDYVCKPPFNSESMICDDNFWRQKFSSLLIVCGVGGRTIIEDAVREKKIKVERLECYRRDKPKYLAKNMLEFITENEIKAVTLTSIEITESVTEHLELISGIFEWQKEIVAFVFSERIGKRARELGFLNVQVAAEASQTKLISLILDWWEKNSYGEKQ